LKTELWVLREGKRPVEEEEGRESKTELWVLRGRARDSPHEKEGSEKSRKVRTWQESGVEY
jgi:hypothetical protein